MGPRWWGFPFFPIATTRYGISAKISLEPLLGYYTWTEDYESEREEEDTTYSYSSREKSSLFLIGGLTNYALRGNAKSNVYMRIGVIIATGTWESSSSRTSSKTFGYGLLLGYGLEHFISKHFAINMGVLSCLWLYRDEYIGRTFTSKKTSSGLIFGNQLLDFTLIWYY
jgi:hypothetical protein